MKKEITYFETTKENHTLETFEIIEQKIRETGIRKIILASTTGRTAMAAMESGETTRPLYPAARSPVTRCPVDPSSVTPAKLPGPSCDRARLRPAGWFRWNGLGV